VLAGGLEKSIEKSVRSSNPSATATVISVNGTPADGRRLAAADVAFEVSLPQYIEEDGEAPTEEEAGAAANSAFAALSEAVAAPDFATVLSESMEEAAHQLVESGAVEEAEMAALAASVEVVVETVVAEEPQVGEVQSFELPSPCTFNACCHPSHCVPRGEGEDCADIMCTTEWDPNEMKSCQWKADGSSKGVCVGHTQGSTVDVFPPGYTTPEPGSGNEEDDYGEVGNFDWMEGAAASCRGGLWAWGLVFVVAAL
jgi:hypothetical protein